MVKPCAKEMKCDVEVGLQVCFTVLGLYCVSCCSYYYDFLLLLLSSVMTRDVVPCKFDISFSRGMRRYGFHSFMLFNFSLPHQYVVIITPSSSHRISWM